MNLKAIFAATMLSSCAITNAEILSLEINSGYDTNPFQLSDSLPIDAVSFFEPRFKYKQRFSNGLFLNGNLRSSFFSGNADDANETKAYFGGGIKNKFKFLRKKSSYKFEARYYIADKTYISRNTGQIATFGGQEIANRYDADWINLKGSVDLKFNKTFAIDLEAQYREKNYDSFATLGLSNLDYSQYFYKGIFNYRADKENRFKIGAEFGTRDYDNRLAKLLDGSDISGSNLVYDYQRYSFDYRNKKGKFSWNLGFNSEQRTDNGGGFYDTVKNRAYAKAKYKRKSGSFISAKLSYFDQSFDNSIPLGQVQNDEELRSKEGFKIEAEYKRNLVDFGYKEFFIHAKISYEDFDNADPFYIYDQTIIQLGLQWQPF